MNTTVEPAYKSFLTTTSNTRELGGILTSSGTLTKCDKFWRSDVPSKVDENDKQTLLKHNMRTIIDFRLAEEIAAKPSKFVDDNRFTYINVPITIGSNLPESVEFVPLSYLKMTTDKVIMHKIFSIIADSDSGVLFHCTAGKDRTGVTSAILLMLAGVSDNGIVENYMLTKIYLQKELEYFKTAYPTIDERIFTPSESYIQDFITSFKEKYGSAEGYFEWLGIGEKSELIKKKLVQLQIGLERGSVRLCDHETSWESLAAETINRLKNILGNVAVDIQHIGSTSIRAIKAKPIIDIAIMVNDFDEVLKLAPQLEKHGFCRRTWYDESQLLFAIGDYSKPNGIITHFIHVVKADDFADYINFRNYLNCNNNIAKEYEKLKIKLSNENLQEREKYIAGKHDFIKTTLAAAKPWARLRNISKNFKIINVKPINKGWSSDKKFCVTTNEGTKYLLRISPIEQLERKKTEFEMMQRVATLGIPMCKPIEFGECDEGVYSLQSWIDGEDAEDFIKPLSANEQYAYGFESGRILRQIHTIPAPPTQPDWEVRFNQKIDRNIQMYNECPVKYEQGQLLVDYVNANRHLLKNRPQCYQHGDYHIGNMMIADKKLLIIDFDRDDFGDPWEEFNRIVWCAQKAPYFASGQVDGYFEGRVPLEFWQLLALYITSNTLSSLPWAITFGQNEIETMQNQACDVLRWYNNMNRVVPAWYSNPSNKSNTIDT